MSLEHLDVQWTVVCDGSAHAAFAVAKARAEAKGRILELEVTDLGGDAISTDGVWPSETLGSGRYVKEDRQTQRTFFWSTYSDEVRAKITGGLYLHEYAGESDDALAACEEAVVDLRHLFGAPEVSCLVLTLEDDDGVDVSPGIVGIYRAAVWREVSGKGGGGVVEVADGEWVIVRPAVPGGVPTSVHSMPEPAQSSLATLQSSLERLFWGDVEEL